MRYHTKEYYTLMMSLGTVDLYEPVVDKDYSDEEIEELFQQALDRYVEEERAEYDEPPVIELDEDDEYELDEEDIQEMIDEYMNREPFDEKESEEDFREMYSDNLEEPDEDLPDWVRETVDPRILAMNLMPEKIYRKLAMQDEINEKKFDEIDERADEAFEELRETLPDEYVDFMDALEELENSCVTDARIAGDKLALTLLGWDDEGDEAEIVLKFAGVEVIEDEDIRVDAWEDEDGDADSDCELLFSELYMEDGRPEVHMLFDNNGLKNFTFRCSEAAVTDGSGKETEI